MGACLATAALDARHEVVVVSGPVNISYPSAVQLVHVVTTSQLQEAVCELYPKCDGIIAAAAPCDFKANLVATSKIKKTGEGITLELRETEDILKKVSIGKRADQWSVGFALETENGVENAQQKLVEKQLDLIVLNGPGAMNSETNQVRIIANEGVVAQASGSKQQVASEIVNVIDSRLSAS